ncbi:MAG TPA: ABC transporter ATP-binding protein [Planctomycetota bacterium]|nr:ABC transporter ATP-binding protein [Planctomycetota bacterium]
MAAAIEIVDVYKKLGSRQVLDGVSLSVETGQILAVVGPSGVGKSTLIKHIVGLMKPDKGDVLVEGRSVVSARRSELGQIRQSIGLVFQGAALLNSLTVAENVGLPLVEHTSLPKERIREIVEEKLGLVHLEGFEDYMPADLSGGMKKRVGLARALVRDPRIILYDEPTAGLDPIMSNAIVDLAGEVRQKTGATSIIITHDIHTVFRVADRAAMIFRGKFIAQGTVEEMRNTRDPAVRQFLEGNTHGPLTDD